MAGQEKKPDEEKDIHSIEEKYSFIQKEWKVQRVFEILMVLFLSGGFLGLFGEGWLSNKTISDDGIKIEYQQYLRTRTPTELFIYLNNPPDTTVVSFNTDYLAKVKIEQIVPLPIGARTENQRLFYTFNTAPGGIVSFYMVPQRVGSLNLMLQIQKETKHLEQFVYF